jgi:hypothetical protein
MSNGIFTLKQVNQALRQGAWITGIKTPAVEYLVVAGGGNGGDLLGGGLGAGGGGAGGLLTGITPVPFGSVLTVTVGAGLGRFGEGTGGSSVFGQVSTTGGGSGARGGTNAGRPGGSGGGGSGTSYPNGYQGIFGQGNSGGNSPANSAAGGGGGAGTVGFSGYDTIAGSGGAGIASAISGNVTAYAGGGGGGGGTPGVGGVGGGGNAGSSAGTANTGGGGGGSSGFSDGFAGGSGIVVVSYPDVYQVPAATTGSPTVSTSGSGSIDLVSTKRFAFANNAAFQFGVGDFTVEAFVYATAFSAYQNAVQCSDQSSWANGWTLTLDNGRPDFWINATRAVVAPSAIPTSTWAHLAVVRSGTTITMYVNGVSVATATSIANIIPTNGLSVGGEVGTTGFPLNGYVSNVRVVKGSAVYTTGFTTPAAPLTAVSGTSLLLGANSGAFLTDTSGNSFVPNLAVNSPTWSQLSPFATGLGFKNRVYTWTSSGSITF